MYVQTIHALASNIFVTLLVITILALRHLHPLVEVNLPPFVSDFHPKMDLVLDKKAFIFIVACFPCLSFNGLLNMVYELLQDCFVPNDSTTGFHLLFEICKHIACGHVPPLVSSLLVALQLLALEKQVGGI
jgi:hypothetical protein